MAPSASGWSRPNGPGPVGPDAVLRVGGDLALDVDQVRDRALADPHDDQDLDQDDRSFATTGTCHRCSRLVSRDLGDESSRSSTIDHVSSRSSDSTRPSRSPLRSVGLPGSSHRAPRAPSRGRCRVRRPFRVTQADAELGQTSPPSATAKRGITAGQLGEDVARADRAAGRGRAGSRRGRGRASSRRAAAGPPRSTGAGRRR